VRPSRTIQVRESYQLDAGISALIGLLWLLSAIPIQPLAYEWLGVVAMSESRLSALEQDSGTRLGSFELLKWKPIDSKKSEGSELRNVAIRLRMTSPLSTAQIEQELENSTRPTTQCPEVQSAGRQLLFARWELESWKHHAKLGAEPMAEVTTTKDSGVFHLASHVTSTVPAAENSDVEVRIEECQCRVDKLADHAEQVTRKSHGFLKISGKSQLKPVVPPLGISSLLWLGMIFGLLWSIVYWSHRILAIVRSLGGGLLVVAFRKRKRNKFALQTIRRLARNGVPLLAVIPVAIVETSQAAQVKDLARSKGDRCGPFPFLLRISYGALAIWVCVFAVRCGSSPEYRDLCISAPLAGVSRLVSGLN
jgi:hypothetical protein